MSLDDARGGSPSPEPDFEQDLTNMSEDKYNRDSSEEKSPDRASNGNKPASKSNAKDPSRPRRKKARRACFACQRAHLTCGDERPCVRCIKRGLQDSCQDGVRKKAKYLHDAPPEALLPGYHGTYNVNVNGNQSISAASGVSLPTSNGPVSQPSNYFQGPPNNYPTYASPTEIGSQMVDTSMTGTSDAQANINSPPQFQHTSNQQMSPVQGLPSSSTQPSNMPLMGNPSYESALLDQYDPTFFNMNIPGFDNQYGAMELSMLGHMTSGAVNTPELESIDFGQPNQSFSATNLGYTQGYQPWEIVPSRHGSTNNLWALQHNGMDAYAVADTSASMTGTSPGSQNQDWSAGLLPNVVSPETTFAQPEQKKPSEAKSQPPRKLDKFPALGPKTHLARRLDTKHIYASVKAPYPYTQRFHRLTEYLHQRYPPDKKLRIAKALAEIRPTFISLTSHLSEDDLIFMEQSFQRALVEYEDRWQAIGTPSLICRRTGEIVSCNKEFALVTGWRKDVLLGKEPNMNVNFGSSSGTHTGTSSRGAATPRMPNSEADSIVPQPVFLTEVMDQDNVVCFFEKFAELGFSASTPAMPNSNCSLIKYRTKDDPGWGPEDKLRDGYGRVKKEGGKDAGLKALGGHDDTIEMCMTWMVRHDIFDMPMMTVINFLPRI